MTDNVNMTDHATSSDILDEPLKGTQEQTDYFDSIHNKNHSKPLCKFDVEFICEISYNLSEIPLFIFQF